MSVITTHLLQFENAKQRMEEAGICPPDTLVRRNGEDASFTNVLDYTKCCPSLAAEVREDYEKEGWHHMNEETGKYEKVPYTEAELDQLMKFPIYFKDENTVMYFVNYSTDALPAKMISAYFPEETMKYSERMEGCGTMTSYMKDGNSCRADGRAIDDMIPCYGVTGVPGKPGKCRVSMPVDNTDKRFALLYTDTVNVQSADLFSNDKRKMLCVENADAKATVYRCLADGTKTKETMTFRDLSHAVDKAMQEYMSQPKKPKQRDLPKVADEMENDQPVSEQQMGE